VHEFPAFPGLQIVVVGTQQIQEVEHRVVGLGPVDAMISLEVALGRTALGRAGGVEPLKRTLLVGCCLPAEVGDADHGRAPGEDRGHERVSCRQQLAHGRQRDRSIADQFAGLAFDGRSSQPGVVVDAQQELDRRPRRLLSRP
jgi:hypothetical protein